MATLDLNSSVQFIIENHNFLTDEHMEMLDKLWHLKYSQSEDHDCEICSEVQAQPQAEVQAQAQAQLQPELEQKKPRPAYNHSQWPSPIPKVFVQYIRGNNAWNYSYPGKTAWTSEFKEVWQLSGNTEFKLTHENCLRYLAYRMALTPEQLMEKTPHEVHAKLIGPHHGIRGYYIKRFY
jgi:hypothetical protein